MATLSYTPCASVLLQSGLKQLVYPTQYTAQSVGYAFVTEYIEGLIDLQADTDTTEHTIMTFPNGYYVTMQYVIEGGYGNQYIKIYDSNGTLKSNCYGVAATNFNSPYVFAYAGFAKDGNNKIIVTYMVKSSANSNIVLNKNPQRAEQELSEIAQYFSFDPVPSAIIGAGGGATHIAKVTGLLSALSGNLSDILIVAGGGGGGLVSDGTPTAGANGGGISGSGNNSADQSTGYAFGQGEASGGGGGLYGGYKAANGDSGGAGSGYIGNALLDAKKMVGYNVPTSDVESTKTESVNVYSATAEENKPKAGNGFAKITWLRDLPPTPPITALYDWDFTQSLVDTVQGEIITLSNATRSASGIYFDNSHSYATIPPNLLQADRKYEIHFGTCDISHPSAGNKMILAFRGSSDPGFYYRGTTSRWGTWDPDNGWQTSNISDLHYFDNSVLTIEITPDNKWHLYKDDTLFYEPPNAISLVHQTFTLGDTTNAAYRMTIKAFKIFEA